MLISGAAALALVCGMVVPHVIGGFLRGGVTWRDLAVWHTILFGLTVAVVASWNGLRRRNVSNMGMVAVAMWAGFFCARLAWGDGPLPGTPQAPDMTNPRRACPPSVT